MDWGCGTDFDCVHASEWDEIVMHGDPGKPEFLAYYVKDGYVAATSMGRGRARASPVEVLGGIAAFVIRPQLTQVDAARWSGD